MVKVVLRAMVGESRVVRWAVCMWVLWMAGFSACAYAQDRSASRHSQVVLIARLPDTFAVNSQDATASVAATGLGGYWVTIALHSVGQLIPGTNATTACSVSAPGQPTPLAISRTRLQPELNVRNTLAVESGCDGIFRILNGPTDLTPIETPDTRHAASGTLERVDVIFSIL